jgi:hypothetical protein
VARAFAAARREPREQRQGADPREALAERLHPAQDAGVDLPVEVAA